MNRLPKRSNPAGPDSFVVAIPACCPFPLSTFSLTVWCSGLAQSGYETGRRQQNWQKAHHHLDISEITHEENKDKNSFSKDTNIYTYISLKKKKNK